MLLSDVYLWLAYSGISTRKLNRLLEEVPLTKLWDSFGEDTTRLNLDDKTFSTLKRSHNEDYIKKIKYYLEINHIEYVTRADPLFPESLSQREVDPPLALFYKGDIYLARGDKNLAVVGTRRASPYGKYATEKIVKELAYSGFTIVSGLATGIDGFAHAATLDVGGKTVAVLGSGINNVTPVSNLALFDKICKVGLVLSEYPPDVHGSVYTFPQRNRIISGLSKGVLVVEAAEKSGALITADCALEQGRDVFAVPGDIDKPRSIGTNKLIKQGGIAVTSAADILDYYGQSTITKPQTIALDFTEQRVMDILSSGETTFDALVEKSGLTVSELNTALSSLIIYGLVHEKSKNLYTAT
ncbi:MAG: DNA-processing protein DprA [Clostridiales bacterium]|nr:DNA-processing protein DprA [Clostridiales bacterium]